MNYEEQPHSSVKRSSTNILSCWWCRHCLGPEEMEERRWGEEMATNALKLDISSPLVHHHTNKNLLDVFRRWGVNVERPGCSQGRWWQPSLSPEVESETERKRQGWCMISKSIAVIIWALSNRTSIFIWIFIYMRVIKKIVHSIFSSGGRDDHSSLSLTTPLHCLKVI